MRSRRVCVHAGLALLALASVAAQARSLFPGADPDMEAASGRYYLYPTGSGDEGSMFVWRSTDLRKWTMGPALLRKADIKWIDDDGAPRHGLWAPDMVHARSGWFFYYSVGPQFETPSRIGVARCEGPEGPCRDSGRPLITGGNGFEAIDPCAFVDPKSGNAYLYAGGSAGAKLRVWLLKPDMVTLDHEVSIAQPPNFTEGAFMHERDGTYYLSYSSGHWRKSSYSVHYATAPTPTGPWTYRGPILRSDDRYKGPGHHAFLRDPRNGRWYVAYHRWENVTGGGPYPGQRQLALQPIRYTGAGLIAPVSMR